MLLFESCKNKKKKKVKKAKLKKHPMFFTKPHNEEILFKTEVTRIYLKQSCKIPIAHSPEARFIFTSLIIVAKSRRTDSVSQW